MSICTICMTMFQDMATGSGNFALTGGRKVSVLHKNCKFHTLLDPSKIGVIAHPLNSSWQIANDKITVQNSYQKSSLPSFYSVGRTALRYKLKIMENYRWHRQMGATTHPSITSKDGNCN